jgi:hypothetical protein
MRMVLRERLSISLTRNVAVCLLAMLQCTLLSNIPAQKVWSQFDDLGH